MNELSVLVEEEEKEINSSNYSFKTLDNNSYLFFEKKNEGNGK